MRLGPFLGSIWVVFSIYTVALGLQNIKAVMVNRGEDPFRPWNKNENTSFTSFKNLGGWFVHIPTRLIKMVSIKY